MRERAYSFLRENPSRFLQQVLESHEAFCKLESVEERVKKFELSVISVLNAVNTIEIFFLERYSSRKAFKNITR